MDNEHIIVDVLLWGTCIGRLKWGKSFSGPGVYKPRTREALEHLMVHEDGKFLIEEYISPFLRRPEDSDRARF